MDVVNESEFTLDEITDETLKCVRLGGKRVIIYIIIVGIALISCIVGLIVSNFNKKALTDFIIIGICLLIMLFILIYFLAFYPKRIRKTYEESFGGSVKFKYIFHINRLECIAETVKQSGKNIYTYDALRKVIETNTTLRIYINKNNFLPVKKECFIPNEFEKIKKAMLNSNVKYKEKIK